MNAIQLLKDDHNRVSHLFDQMKELSDISERKELFQEIRSELDAHAQIEESVLYPMFADREGFEEIVEESLDEHEEIKGLLEELDETDDESEFNEKFDELVDCVEHHVEDEEEEFFPRIEATLSEDEVSELGIQLQEAKRSVAGGAAAA